MSSKKKDKEVIPIQSIENENQTLLPQANDGLTENNDDQHPNSSDMQANNSQYEDRINDTKNLSTGKYPVITKPSKEDDAKSKRRCKCCTCKCCAISSGVIIGLVVLILVIGAVMWKQRKDAAKENIEKFQAGSEEWEKKLHSSDSDSQFGMSGTYELKGYDKNYEEYMKAFGIPAIILSFIIGTPETLIITEPDENNKFYTIKTITGNGARIAIKKFELNKEHETEYNRGKGVMQTICKVTESNVLECNSDEKSKDWKLTNKFEFDPLGIINTRTFHSKNIVAKKYYERQGVDISNEEQKSASAMDAEMIKVEKTDDKNTENPFGDDDWEDENDEWE